MANYIILLSLVGIYCTVSITLATSPLQDFCVADLTSSVTINGQSCLDAKLVRTKHFLFRGLDIPGNTSNKFGSAVTPVFVAQLPGLNTLGISAARIDYAPWGIVAPHVHHRASEMLTVIEGTIEAGFVTSNPDNRLFRKVLKKGDNFVFPVGLVHYQRNVGNEKAVSISGLSNENPGVSTVGNVVFGSNPSISSDLLAKSFQVDQNVVKNAQVKF